MRIIAIPAKNGRPARCLSVTAALFLSQAVYWQRRCPGWFYKTQEQWEAETGLSRSEQEHARMLLRSSKVLREERRGIPAKLWYRVDEEILANRLSECNGAEVREEADKNAEMPQARLQDSCIQERGIAASSGAEFLLTTKEAETTQRLRTETTKPLRARGASDSRHVLFMEACQRYAEHVQVTWAWDGSDAKQLALLLKAAPDLTLDTFQRCLQHRARSEGVTAGDRPRAYLPTILRYQQGSLDRYGNLKGESGGTNQRSAVANRGQQRTNSNIANALEALTETDGIVGLLG